MLLTVLVIIVMIVVIVIDKMIKESKWTTNFKNTSMGSGMIKEFEHQKEEATESPEKKYSINIDSINSAMKISKELAERSIARGMQMQNEDGPQRSWAIAGGMADGLFGPGAGAAVAIKTMQDNAEATRKHHEMGKQMMELGVKDLERVNDNWRELLEIANNRKDKFKYSQLMPDLLDFFEYSADGVSVSDLKKIEITEYTKSGTSKTTINAVDAYNNLGYFQANIKIKNKKDDIFPEDIDKERIDGGFIINLYDDDKKVAYGYVTDGSWNVKNHSDVGFKSEINKDIIFKLVDDSQFIVWDKKYSVKFSDPNLWLVKVHDTSYVSSFEKKLKKEKQNDDIELIEDEEIVNKPKEKQKSKKELEVEYKHKIEESFDDNKKSIIKKVILSKIEYALTDLMFKDIEKEIDLNVSDVPYEYIRKFYEEYLLKMFDELKPIKDNIKNDVLKLVRSSIDDKKIIEEISKKYNVDESIISLYLTKAKNTIKNEVEKEQSIERKKYAKRILQENHFDTEQTIIAIKEKYDFSENRIRRDISDAKKELMLEIEKNVADILIENEGNAFKSIKVLMDKYNLDKETAKKCVEKAYKDFGSNS